MLQISTASIRSQLRPALALAQSATQVPPASRRPFGFPHLARPIEAARILLREASVTDLDVLTAALLQDVPGAARIQVAELSGRFGAPAAQLVSELACLDDLLGPAPHQRAYQVAVSAYLSRNSRMILMANLISNIRDMVGSPDRESDPVMHAYLLHAGQLVDQIRGTNLPLELLFEDALAIGLASIGRYGSGAGGKAST